MPRTDTRTEILAIARDIVATEGLGGVSFDAIARRLGRSKQAVLYWFPSRTELLAALFLPWLEAEADAAIAALTDAQAEAEATGAFVRAIAGFHFADLERFRAMYLAPQITRKTGPKPGPAEMTEAVHPVTDRLYHALAGHLAGRPDEARRKAAAIHAAVLGLVTMFALADALNDPLKHSRPDLLDALIASFGAH